MYEVYNCLKGVGERVFCEGYIVQVPIQVIANWVEVRSFVKTILHGEHLQLVCILT